MWGCLTVAGLLLAGCSFEHGGGASSPDPAADGGGGGFSDGLPHPDGGVGTPDAAAPDGAPPIEPVLLDTLTVPADGQTVTSTVVLVAGASYQLVASGELVVNDDGFSADSDFWWDDDLPGVGFNGFDGVDYCLAVNDTVVDGNCSPDWGDFAGSHTYESTMAGTGSTLVAQFHDRDYENGNSGSLTLEIWGPP